MNKPLLSQLIKLEEMFEETHKSGTPVQEELKVAILLKCISGPLKTQLNLMLGGSAKYADVRDQVLRWDRSQQKWTGLVVPSEDNRADEVVPVEVDRIGQTGWSKGKGEKGKGKGNSKGFYNDLKAKARESPKARILESHLQKVTKVLRGNPMSPKVRAKPTRPTGSAFDAAKLGILQKTAGQKSELHRTLIQVKVQLLLQLAQM